MDVNEVRKELELLKDKADKVFDLCEKEQLNIEQTFTVCMIVAATLLRRVISITPLMNTAIHGLMAQMHHTPSPKDEGPKH